MCKEEKSEGWEGKRRWWWWLHEALIYITILYITGIPGKALTCKMKKEKCEGGKKVR